MAGAHGERCSMHHGIHRIPADVFKEEKVYLQPYYGTPQPPKVEMKEYTVRKDNTVSYHCCYYTVPSGTYHNAGTHVLVEEVDERLHIYSKGQARHWPYIRYRK